jgi:hypothetical protein
VKASACAGSARSAVDHEISALTNFAMADDDVRRLSIL